MDVLIGTKNEYKATEMASYFEGLDFVNVHFLKNHNFNISVVEDGKTLMENAVKKAVEISKKTGSFTLASDGGVDIPGLVGWDFLKNQRTVGQEKTDLEKVKKVLEMMEGLQGEQRKAEYHLALAFAKEGTLLWSDEKIIERGYIATKLVDENIPEYRWMGHIWYYPQFEKVFNKLSAREVNEVREQAKELKENLQNFLTIYISSVKL